MVEIENPALRLGGNFLTVDSLMPMFNEDASYIQEYFGFFLILFAMTASTALLYMKTIKARRLEAELEANQDMMNSNIRALFQAKEKIELFKKEIHNQGLKINDLVFKDMLTKLDSRFSIFHTIDNYLKKKSIHFFCAIAILDIDEIKNINDTFGQDIGDRVLKAISNKLQKHCGDNFNIARFGGDEFVFFITNCASIEEIKCSIRNVHDEFYGPIKIDDLAFTINASIGIALFNENLDSRNELLRKADLALLEAKKTGKNKCAYYSNLMERNLEEKIRFQSAVKEAFINNEFFLKYQPLVDSEKEKIIAFEALIRWNSGFYGEVSPYEIIRTAEEMGLIIELGKWIFKEALCFAGRINENREEALKVSVNFSAIEFTHEDFCDFVLNCTEMLDINPELVCLELTETILIESLEKVETTIKKLQTAGFCVALDDFGTGYSSLKYLKELPVDIVKIDRSFVKNILKGNYEKQLVVNMVQLAHYKGAKVVVEGVEEEGQKNCLRKCGCDIFQGYLFSKPLGEDDLVEYIENCHADDFNEDKLSI